MRKCIFALAIVALALGSAVTASAQVGAPGPGFTCTVNAGVTPLLRAEGLTELTGDIQLNCTGGAPTAAGLQVPQVNIQVFLNTNLTSRLYSNGGMEALLMIDEPQPGQQRPCGSLNGCTIPGNPTATTATLPAGPIGTGVDYRTGSFLSGESTIGIPNIYQGRQAGANAVVFLGVPIDPPGTAGTRQVRITNLRSNANQLGVSSTLVPTQVVAFISASPPQLMGINNPQQTVGFVAPGMNFSLRNAA
ncbi:MAG: hypothetical protein HYZ57_00345, partial [Acidobacteria bacterium]|nr:hypothetical protein [Acidobacteriota bacterium]